MVNTWITADGSNGTAGITWGAVFQTQMQSKSRGGERSVGITRKSLSIAVEIPRVAQDSGRGYYNGAGPRLIKMRVSPAFY